MKRSLPFSEISELVYKFSEDFCTFSSTNSQSIPSELKYIIKQASDQNSSRKARKAAFNSLDKPIKKFAFDNKIKKQVFDNEIKKQAFDTRRIDQESTRNPRTNLQYWHRSQEFIDDELQSKINIFAKLKGTLDVLKETYGTDPDWHNSYARVLSDAVDRILRIKQGDHEVDRAQIAYLEQLMEARYRLGKDDILRLGHDELSHRILRKDEALLKRGVPQNNMTKSSIVKNTNNPSEGAQVIMKQNDALAALFGSGGLRREGERNVTRTITITINDAVKD